ncbi:MAG: sugar phosphate isomerase/epimerase [Oscillospiraceae bacterium]|nr:sugar phosphate isomerase/epimerase [Oscillospiraceae bacterium]
MPVEQMLPLVRQKGFTCGHLALSKLFKELPCTPSALTPGYAHYLKRVFAENSIDIAVIGNYLNLLHPDEAYLSDAMEKYYAHIRFASLLGCGMVGTETGAPNREYTFCPECRKDETLSLFIKRLKPIVRCAEEFGVVFAIEPVARHSVYDPKTCRRVLDEIGSHNLQVLFDPVNLLDLENVDRREELFQEAMELLGRDIAMVHLKDFVRVEEGYGLKSVGAGTGEMDYSAIMKFLKREKPFIYATLENTTPENAVACRQAMQDAYDRA